MMVMMMMMRKIEELDGGGWFAQLGTRLLFGLPSCLHFSAFTLVSTLFLFYLFGVRSFLFIAFLLVVHSFSLLFLVFPHIPFYPFSVHSFSLFFYFVSALFSFFLCNEYDDCGEVCICKGGKLWCLYVFYQKSFRHQPPFSLYFLFKVI